MSDSFLREFNFPSNVVHLRVKPGPESNQLAEIVQKVAKQFHENRPNVALIPGDTNSALGAALAAFKEGVPIAHLEAGARSYDNDLPEEINRKLIDHCSSMLFAPTKQCARNLMKEGITSSIKVVGDTMYDLIKSSMPKIRSTRLPFQVTGTGRRLATLTVHRQATVDQEPLLRKLVKIVGSLAGVEFVFPLHPRTKIRLKRAKILSRFERLSNVRIVPPLSYFGMLSLVCNSDLVLTDSGGLQKEAFWLGVPCITLRERTEWNETVKLGANILTGLNERKIRRAVKQLLTEVDNYSRLLSLPNPFGDGKAAVAVVQSLQHMIRER
jgi:UDP-N-acetylglucosamine 2-epimerase (non-hydrolysing)